MVKDAFKKLPEDKKNTIVKSGIAEFSRKSYSEASTDEITKNSGISKVSCFIISEAEDSIATAWNRPWKGCRTA